MKKGEFKVLKDKELTKDISYIKIPSAIISKSKELNKGMLLTYIVLQYISIFKDNNENIIVTANSIASAYNLDNKTVSNAIQELHNLNLIKIDDNNVIKFNSKEFDNENIEHVKKMNKKINKTKSALNDKVQELEKQQLEDAIEHYENINLLIELDKATDKHYFKIQAIKDKYSVTNLYELIALRDNNNDQPISIKTPKIASNREEQEENNIINQHNNNKPKNNNIELVDRLNNLNNDNEVTDNLNHDTISNIIDNTPAIITHDNTITEKSKYNDIMNKLSNAICQNIRVQDDECDFLAGYVVHSIVRSEKYKKIIGEDAQCKFINDLIIDILENYNKKNNLMKMLTEFAKEKNLLRA